jgi:4-amino-4-deoxy-L-arabinose transferase-like glycosyltransferase
MSRLQALLIHSALYRKSIHFTQESLYKGLWLAAALSFFTTLTLPYIGEEAVYTITSQEMYFYQSWFKPIIYGSEYGRPPLYNWLIILLTQWLGLENVLVAARLVSALMSILSSVLLYVLVCQGTENRWLALLSVGIFFSGDLLLRRGWLAYSDPTFAFFCFTACSCLWLSVHKKQCRYLCIAVLAMNAAFLTKAITGYIFFFGTACILFFYKPYRSFLLKPRMLYLQVILQILSLCCPLGWHFLFSEGMHGTGVIKDIQNQLVLLDISEYLRKLVVFPFDVWLRFFPTSFIVAGFLIFRWRKQKRQFKPLLNLGDAGLTQEQRFFRITLGIVLLNTLPYWLAPQMRIRYILPLYPFIAILFAYGVWRFEKACLSWVTVGLLCTVILRFVLGFLWFPYYEQRYRGDNQAVAADIVQRAAKKPIYTNYGGSIGVIVAAHVNALRLTTGDAPVLFPEDTLPAGLLFSDIPNYQAGELVKTYQLGRTSLYLFTQH